MTDYEIIRVQIQNLEKIRDDLANRIAAGCDQKIALMEIHAKVCKALRALYGN